MAQLEKLPEAHTDFIISVQWDGVVWALVLLGLAGAALVIGFLLYRRRRGRKNSG
jgi:cell division protein FtsW (lipid II flippase)